MQLLWGELTQRLIKLKWSLGVPAPTISQGSRRQEVHPTSNKALIAGQDILAKVSAPVKSVMR